MANIYKKPAVITRLQKSVPGGTDWLVNALNPFPDYIETPEGMPDASVQQTAVKKFTKTITISAPNGIVTNWDCFACFMPFDSAPTTTYTGTRVNLPQINPVGVFQSFSVPTVHGNNVQGILQIFSGPSGANVIPWSPSFAVLSTEINGLSCYEAWSGQGSVRVVSAGFECTNTTPALYRGGSLTAFRQESVRTEGVSQLGVNTLPTTVFSGYPSTLAECIRIPGALQWNAEDGAYIVGTFDSNMHVFESPPAYHLYGACATTLGIANQNALAGSYDPAAINGLTVPTHLDMSGMFATGLNNSTTLTFTMHLVLEIVPLTSSVMIDFVKPPVPYSPGLLEAYALTKAAIPAAAKKDDNDFGDFMKSITAVLTPALSIAFPEFAPFFGVAAYGINKAVDLSRSKQAKKKDVVPSSDKTQRPKRRVVAPKSPTTRIKAPRKGNKDEYRKMLVQTERLRT